MDSVLEEVVIERLVSSVLVQVLAGLDKRLGTTGPAPAAVVVLPWESASDMCNPRVRSLAVPCSVPADLVLVVMVLQGLSLFLLLWCSPKLDFPRLLAYPSMRIGHRQVVEAVVVR
jgi:hypothetical protein